MYNNCADNLKFFVDLPITKKIGWRRRDWLKIMFLFILLASGTTIYTGFFDSVVLPKQLAAYFISGISGIILSILSFFKVSQLDVTLNKYLFVFVFLGGFVLILHKDFHSLLDVIYFIVVYALCRQIRDKKKASVCFIIALAFCSCYSIIICLWQYVNNDSINGGYDTVSGLSLTLTILFVLLMNIMLKQGKKIISIFIFMLIVISLFIFLSMRTAVIAISCSSAIVLNWKFRIYIIVIALIAIVLLSICKADSTSGRFFIYKTSLSLFDSPEHIFKGQGASGFRKTYMKAQAKQLRNVPDKKRDLAENIKHPLNDFLYFAINYGIPLLLIGFILFILFIIKEKSDFLSYSLFATVIVFALFTYPFHYPMTHATLAFAFSRTYSMKPKYGLNNNQTWLYSTTLLVLGIILIVTSLKLFVWNKDWKKAFISCWYCPSEQSLSEYEKLSNTPLASDEFYYNWAYMLLRAGRNVEAEKAIGNCKIVDYDTQMLRGDMYASLEMYKDALLFYKEASDMCPNKFIPLYAQFVIYNKVGMLEKQTDIGHIILKKKEKVPSTVTQRIKDEVYNSIY